MRAAGWRRRIAPAARIPVNAWHDDVGDDHVGRQSLGRIHEGPSVADGPDDLELRLEQGAPELRRRRVIVGEQHPPATLRLMNDLYPPLTCKCRLAE
jgi:hypothetical protein